MPNVRYAVVGVSDDPNKYGYKVFTYLLRHGYDVTPIHPDNGRVAGVVRYRTLSEMPHVPDTVVTVVPPTVTEKIVRECAHLKVPHVWMQPGSESEAAIAYGTEQGIQVTAHACIMLQ